METPESARLAGEQPLVDVGRARFAILDPDAQPTVIELPDGFGICLVYEVRGGGKLYVAPDETVLFVGSATDFETGLTAFRGGARTPRDVEDAGGHPDD